MKLFKAQAVLLSNKNLLCVQRLKEILTKYDIGLIYSGDFFDFITKVINTMPEFIFIDASTFNVENFPFNLLNNSVFKEKTKVVILSDNFSCSNPYIKVVGLCKLESYIIHYTNNINDEDKFKIHKDYTKEINNFLLKVGISPKYIGRDYLTDCINLVLNNKLLINELCEYCYVCVAGKNKSKATCVERNIRWAIKYSYLKREPNVWENTFGIEFNAVPPNKYFICLCVDKLSEILKF